ncbi:MAG: DUF1573 domain-containing protein [Alphaproteobacteria bacterium]|nr:DUF1573 domain-containing protein [Alphaproteobacteria bacterium]
MISFEHTAIKTNISSLKVHEQVFKGVNLSNDTIRVVTKSTSCGCTVAQIPNEIKPLESFEVIMVVNKVGQSGLFATKVTLLFSNDQEVILTLSGNIE